VVLIQAYDSKYRKIFDYFSFFNLSFKQEIQLKKFAEKNPSMVPIAIHKNKPIGIAVGYIEKSREAWLLGIYVQEKFRHQGVGKQLILFLEQQVRSNNSWHVRVKPKFKQYIPFLIKKANYHVIENLNLYIKQEITFPYSKIGINLPLKGKIREATLEDIDQLIFVEHRCFDPYWHNDKDDWIAIIKNKKQILLNVFEIPSPNKSAIIIGYNYNSVHRYKDFIEAQFIRIASLPDFQQFGIATTLTSLAFEWFREQQVNSVYLSTIKSNKQLNEMYQNWGFTKYGEEIILAKFL